MSASIRVIATTVVVLALAALAPAVAQAKFFGGMVRDVPTRAAAAVGAATAGRVDGAQFNSDMASHHANLPYGGGPVLHSNRTHVIFWAPAGSSLAFDPGYQALIETFLSDVADASHRTTNVYSLSGQ
ncbi:MAG: hypothetical protein JO130_18840, partial [Solirubrobacterales bacterium]|nr:hypothetical protein [Solirubrobacterales bacterium]